MKPGGFKLDLSKFRKIGSDSHMTTFQHPEGHTIRVAHSRLSPKLRAQIEKLPAHFDQGGVSELPQADSADQIAADAAAASPDGDASRAPAGTAIDPVLQAKRALYNQVVNSDYTPNPMINAPQSSFGPNGEPPEHFNPSAWRAAEAQLQQQQLREKATQEVAAQKIAEDNQARASAGLPALPAPQGSDQIPAQQAAAPMPAPQGPNLMPQGAMAPQASGPFDDYSKMVNSIMGQGLAGIQAKSQAEQLLGQEHLKAANAQVDTLKNQAQIFQDTLADTQKNIASVVSDIQNNHIDPKHYWNDKSTGGKISTAIGLVLGGIGGGLLHQQNPALQFMNDQIDRDINAQKANLGSKQNLLSAYLHQYGNQIQAENALRATYAGLYAAQIDQAAAKAATPMAQANAQILKSQFEQQFLDATRQMSLYKMMSQTAQSGGADPVAAQLSGLRVLNPAMAKELESRYIPNVGVASLPIPDKVREEMVARSDLDQQIRRLDQFAQQHSGSVDPQTINYGKALARSVQDSYRRANGQGVFREAEKNFVESSIDTDPTKFFGSVRVSPGYKATASSNRNALQNLYRSYGVRLPQIQEGPPKL